jgi:hypothetical protein
MTLRNLAVKNNQINAAITAEIARGKHSGIIFEKQEERFEKVINEYQDFADRYPDSKLLDEAKEYVQLSQNQIKISIFEAPFNIVLIIIKNSENTLKSSVNE